MTFEPRNKTESDLWRMLTNGQSVFVSRNQTHSERKRRAITRMRDCGVNLAADYGLHDIAYKLVK